MDFVTGKKRIKKLCPKCKQQSLELISSTSVDLYYKRDRTLKDSFWFFINTDIKCINCDYRKCISSDEAGKESIKELMKDIYKNTNSSIMLRKTMKTINAP